MSTTRHFQSFEGGAARRCYAVRPYGQWWLVLSEEGEAARYRTRAAALESAQALAEAMRRLGLQSEVVLKRGVDPAAIRAA